MKYLSLYRRCLKLGKLPKKGLCNCLKKYDWDSLPEELKLVLPHDPHFTYWGHEWCIDNPTAEIPTTKKNDIHYGLTPLRQNILLFCAAMAEEF